jgi:hypothetical protein
MIVKYPIFYCCLLVQLLLMYTGTTAAFSAFQRINRPNRRYYSTTTTTRKNNGGIGYYDFMKSKTSRLEATWSNGQGKSRRILHTLILYLVLLFFPHHPLSHTEHSHIISIYLLHSSLTMPADLLSLHRQLFVNIKTFLHPVSKKFTKKPMDPRSLLSSNPTSRTNRPILCLVMPFSL